jgi:hypothetical protein
MVAPVQILQDQYQQLLCRGRVDRLRHLAQHPLHRIRTQPRRQPGLLGLPGQARKLGQPSGRVFPEHCQQHVTIGPSAQSRYGLQDGQVGLTGAVVLDALAMADAQVRNLRGRLPERLRPMVRRGQGRNKSLYEAALADACLSGHKDQLPPAFQRLFQRIAQQRLFDVAANDDILHGRGGGFTVHFRLRQDSLVVDLGDEPIADSMGGRNEAWPSRIVSEGATQVTQACRDHSFGDDATRPNRREQFVLGDHFARTIGKCPQERQRSTCQFDHRIGGPQWPVGAGQAIAAEAKFSATRRARLHLSLLGHRCFLRMRWAELQRNVMTSS